MNDRQRSYGNQALAAKSQQQRASVNIDEALCYPLAPVPLSLATCDGARRKTAKSKLSHVALSSMEVDDVEYVHNETKCYILDLAAIIRSIMRTPDTFRELANNILQDIPKQYDAIYIACDTYRSYSIKNAERSLRGDDDKFVIRSPDVRIPADSKKVLNNGENKERMFELIEEVWIQSRNQNDRRATYFARGSSCIKIANRVSEPVPELNTDHEEADTKLAYLVQHALRENGDNTLCVVRSSSGDRRTIYFARGSSCIKITNGVLEPVPELNTDHEEADTKTAYLVQRALRENGDNTL